MPESALESIGQIAIVVKDVDRAAEFYEKTLGLPLLFRFPGVAFFNCGGVRLMLSLPSDAEFDHPASIIYFRVKSIAERHRELAARGVSFRDEPHLVHRDERHELWMCFFRDCDENTFALMEEVETRA